MYVSDIICMASKNAYRGKMRSLLTSFSVTIGISSILLITTLGNNGEKLIQKEIDRIGLQGITIYQNKDVASEPLYSEDAERLKNRFPEILYAMPIVFETGKYSLNKNCSNALFLGIDENATNIYNVDLLYGREPTSSDIKSKSKIAVIDNEFAKKIYRRENIVSKKIVISLNGKEEEFQIIGVIRSQKEGLNKIIGSTVPEIIYLPYSTLNNMRNSRQIDQISIKCNNENNNGETYVKYLSKIKKSNNGYYSDNVSTKIDEIKVIISLVKLLISAIAAISLCVAGLGIMNVTFSTMSERKKEIGICLAIGASQKNLLTIYLLESIIIALCGGILGALIGSILVKIFDFVFKWQIIINMKNIIFAELISVLCGAIFAIIPVIKASKTQPINVLNQI